MIVQRKTPCGDGKNLKREKGTSPGLEGGNDIKTHSGESDENLKSGHDGHLPPIGEHKKNRYEDVIINVNRDKYSH